MKILTEVRKGEWEVNERHKNYDKKMKPKRMEEIDKGEIAPQNIKLTQI